MLIDKKWKFTTNSFNFSDVKNCAFPLQIECYELCFMVRSIDL